MVRIIDVEKCTDFFGGFVSTVWCRLLDFDGVFYGIGSFVEDLVPFSEHVGIDIETGIELMWFLFVKGIVGPLGRFLIFCASIISATTIFRRVLLPVLGLIFANYLENIFVHTRLGLEGGVGVHLVQEGSICTGSLPLGLVLKR